MLATRNKTGVLSVGIRITVPYRPHTAAGDDQLVSLPKGTMLPKDIMSVGSIAVLPVVIPWIPHWPNYHQVLPVLPVNAQVAFVQTIQVGVW